jgi:hypothetical protein
MIDEQLPQPTSPHGPIERVQVGVRLEKRMVKVLKGLAEYLDLSLADLLEGLVLHAFENAPPFQPLTLQRIAQLKAVYGLTATAADSHQLVEAPNLPPADAD